MIEKRGKDFYEYSYHAALFNQKYILPDVRNQDEDECVFNSLAAGADMGVRKERAKGGLTSDITFDAKSLAQDFLAEESALGLGGLGVLNIQDTARRLFKQQGVFTRSSEWAGPQELTIEGSEVHQSLTFGEAIDIIELATPLLGIIRVDEELSRLGRDEIYRYTAKPKSTEITHMVLFVGYGYSDLKKQLYLVLMNSWGKLFCEDGFGRVSFGDVIRFYTLDVSAFPKAPRCSRHHQLRDGSKKLNNKEQEVIQQDKNELTLEEYEKILHKKSSDPTKPEEMKNTPAVIKGVQLLEKEVENDARVKLENCQLDAEAISFQELRKQLDGLKYIPPARRNRLSNGGYRGGRSNGGYNGPSRDSSMEPRVYNSRYGENTTLLDNADMTQGNFEPRRANGYYNGRGTSRYQDHWGGSIGQRWEGCLESSDGSEKAADKSSIKEYLKPTDGQDSVPPLRRDDHSNGGYRGGRNNLRYQSRRHRYNGEPWEGTHQQGRYNNGRVHNGHQERRDQQGSHNV